MKRILILAFALVIGLTVMSQIPRQDRVQLRKAYKKEFKKPLRDLPGFTMEINPTVSPERMWIVDETQVGITWYDYVTNACTGNLLFVYEDGTMNAAWTYGIEASTFPDRGSGYNYFDGTDWGPQPASRVESIKTGWGHVSDLGQSGEIIIAHDADNLQMCRRDTKGTGEWDEMDYEGVAVPSWPRQVSSGENNEYLHIIYHSYDAYAGMPGAMLYARSADGGNTWDPADIILDGTGSDFYYEIMSETYAMAARGSTVAILMTGSWQDMFIMKSEDNGDNWEKIMVWEHPYPFFDYETTLTDSIFCPDNSGGIAIDPDGKCHVVFGISRVLHDELGSTFSTFPYVDGIGYWNEDMLPFTNDLNALAPPQYGYEDSELVEDHNYIGWTQDVDGDGEITLIETPTGLPMSYDSYGLSTMPTIHIDDEGWIFVVFASTTETYDNFEYNYKKLWERKYQYGIWGPFKHLTQDINHIFDESVYPYIADHSDAQYYYMIYQADGTPGVALNGDHDYQENRMIVAQVEKDWIGIDETNPASLLCVETYPNPCKAYTTLQFTLKQAAKVHISLTDISGKTIREYDKGCLSVGTYFQKIDCREMVPGIYFYTLSSGKEKLSGRLVVL
jgi:hypothetical protein